jgi:hypothetical protein
MIGCLSKKPNVHRSTHNNAKYSPKMGEYRFGEPKEEKEVPPPPPPRGGWRLEGELCQTKDGCHTSLTGVPSRPPGPKGVAMLVEAGR